LTKADYVKAEKATSELAKALEMLKEKKKKEQMA